MAGLLKERQPPNTVSMKRRRKECELCPDGFRLELLTDLDMLLMGEKGIQSGITLAVKRYARASNKYMKDLYNPDELRIYLQYADANNLYGWAMISNLPTHGFKWKKREDFTPEKIDELVKKRQERISFRGRCRVSKRAARKSQ